MHACIHGQAYAWMSECVYSCMLAYTCLRSMCISYVLHVCCVYIARILRVYWVCFACVLCANVGVSLQVHARVCIYVHITLCTNTFVHRISFRTFSFECLPPPQYRPIECCLDNHSFQFGKGHMQQCMGVHSVYSCIDRICIPPNIIIYAMIVNISSILNTFHRISLSCKSISLF